MGTLNLRNGGNVEQDETDGFTSDDGKHQVVWQEAEVMHGAIYETWWCITHDRLYYGGCFMGERDG
jgi:hypothetical protein